MTYMTFDPGFAFKPLVTIGIKHDETYEISVDPRSKEYELR